MGFAQTHPVATRRKTLVRRTPASGTPSARNAAKRNEHGFGVLARAQRSEHVRPSLESNPRGHQRTRFVYASRTNTPELMLKYTSPGATPTAYRIFSDHLGSPRVVVNASNASDVLLKVHYSAFGTPSLEGGSLDAVPMGFAGGLFDPDTALVRFGARDYDPMVGRWVSKDPILFRGKQANLYVYAGNDPVNRIDRRGLADLFLGLDFDLVGINGIEWGLGLVLDTDHPLESGFYSSIGPGSGANVGAALCAGGVARDIEGWGSDADFNVGIGSLAIMSDEKGVQGASIGIGPGVGASFSATYTETITLQDMWNGVKSIFH